MITPVRTFCTSDENVHKRNDFLAFIRFERKSLRVWMACAQSNGRAILTVLKATEFCVDIEVSPMKKKMGLLLQLQFRRI